METDVLVPSVPGQLAHSLRTELLPLSLTRVSQNPAWWPWPQDYVHFWGQESDVKCLFLLPWCRLWVQTSDLLEDSDNGDFPNDDGMVPFG